MLGVPRLLRELIVGLAQPSHFWLPQRVPARGQARQLCPPTPARARDAPRPACLGRRHRRRLRLRLPCRAPAWCGPLPRRAACPWSAACTDSHGGRHLGIAPAQSELSGPLEMQKAGLQHHWHAFTLSSCSWLCRALLCGKPILPVVVQSSPGATCCTSFRAACMP